MNILRIIPARRGSKSIPKNHNNTNAEMVRAFAKAIVKLISLFNITKNIENSCCWIWFHR